MLVQALTCCHVCPVTSALYGCSRIESPKVPRDNRGRQSSASDLTAILPDTGEEERGNGQKNRGVQEKASRARPEERRGEEKWREDEERGRGEGKRRRKEEKEKGEREKFRVEGRRKERRRGGEEERREEKMFDTPILQPCHPNAAMWSSVASRPPGLWSFVSVIP